MKRLLILSSEIHLLKNHMLASEACVSALTFHNRSDHDSNIEEKELTDDQQYNNNNDKENKIEENFNEISKGHLILISLFFQTIFNLNDFQILSIQSLIFYTNKFLFQLLLHLQQKNNSLILLQILLVHSIPFVTKNVPDISSINMRMLSVKL